MYNNVLLQERFLDAQTSLASTPVSPSVRDRRFVMILADFHSVSVSEPSQSVETTLWLVVANMVADMGLDMRWLPIWR